MAQKNQNPAQRQHRQARAEHRVKRQRREAKAQARFTEPLTPKRARHIAKANANLEYRPIEREIGGEIRGSQKREKEIPGWYAGVDQGLAQTQAEGKEVDAATNAAITQQLQNLGAQNAASNASLASKDASFAALVGGPTDAAGAARNNAAGVNLGQQAISMNAPTIQNEAAFNKYIGTRRVSARERGIEGAKSEFQRRRKMIQDLQNARKEKGAATVKGLNQLRSEGRDYLVQQQTLGLKGTEAAEQAKHDAETAAASRQGNRVSAANSKRTQESSREGHRKTRESSEESTAASREGNRISRRNARIAEEKAKYEREHPGSSGEGTGPTRSQKYSNRKEAADTYASAQAAYARIVEQGKPITAGTWSKLEQLLTVQGAGGVAARKAVERLKREHSAGSDVNGPSLGR